MLYLYFMQGTSDDHGFWESLDHVQWSHMSIGFLGAMVPYVAMSLWIGRWAGNQILIRGRSYRLFGIITLQVAGIVATFFGIWISSIDLLGNPFFAGTRYTRMMNEMMIYITCSFWLPTFIFGILGGLITHQIGRKALEQLQQAQES